MRRAAALLAAFILIGLLHATAAAAVSPKCAEMRQRLAGASSAAGLLVADAENGRVLCARAAARARTLASNTKLFTTAAAIARLGPRYRVETQLLARSEPDRAGAVRGDVFLRGGGDPALGSPAFLNRFYGGFGTNLFALRAGLRAAGVRRVDGRLRYDDSVFDRRRGVADSGYATSPWIGPLSGLAFNAGYRTSSGGGFASEPARLAARKLAAGIGAAGIGLRPGVARGRAPANAVALATVRSPTIEQLSEVTNVPSNNFFAEQLLKLLGARFGGAGSTAAGARVVERFARAQGSGIAAVDGSGLTRGNRASPRQVVALLRAMHAGRFADPFIQGLPLSGVEGTVARRMRGTAAHRRCRVKTGTLTGVSALSGYCFNRGGRVVAFSVLMNGVWSTSAAHAAQDRIAALAASY